MFSQFFLFEASFHEFLLFYFLVFMCFCGHFWVFEIFENGFGMRMGDFEGVYLVRLIHLRAPYMNFGFG